MRRILPCLLLLVGRAGCAPSGDTPLLGTLEWDRIGLPAEASEPILRWHVVEGERVEAGQLLLELDPRRQDADIDQARAEVTLADARLRELSNGTRVETLEAAQATLARERATQLEAERGFQRIATLHRRGLVALAELDAARAGRDQARAASRNAEARLRELSNGTRPEQLEQASAVLQAARARLARLRLDRERLSLRAPSAGRVDALPFKPGDQPPRGAELVSLLVGEQPYARVYVPASQRAAIAPGDAMRVRVEGVEQAFAATVSSIRSEAGFTPYFALSGDDASRLMYRAELRLQGAAARRLPAGLPLRAERRHD